MGKPPEARELYDALRALERRAKNAYDKQPGRKFSRRETARKAGGRDSALDRRLAEWLHEEWEEARTPDPGSGEQLMTVVRLWSTWAGEPCDESMWRTLLDEAQPSRTPLRRSEPLLVSTAAGRVDYQTLQREADALRTLVGTFCSSPQGIEGTTPDLVRRVDQLLGLVEREEQRADQELRRRMAERMRRRQAERRATEAERQTAQAVAEVAEARKQLSAASEYIKESDVLLEARQEQLRQLQQEIEVLRRQVQRLTEEHRERRSQKVAQPARRAGVRAGGDPMRMESGPLNADMPWDEFDPEAYISHNYAAMRPEDEEILARVRDHFSDHYQRNGRAVSAIDVGSGPNLYPALAMLPWSEEITLLDNSARNLEYLRAQCFGYDPHWDQFWDVLCKDSAYAQLGIESRERFRDVAQIQQGSLFDLHDSVGRWDLGTMFFVPECITASHAEFRHGVSSFLRALSPGAPFAAAFMKNSIGYQVGDVHFPACDIDEAEVAMTLSDFAQEFQIHHVRLSGIIRGGYVGMILACGHRKTRADTKTPGKARG
ncbi:SCO2525 family SAM-dependent methyltransferase [Streptomyces sp. Li-HN-5-11]|uniref:SCO2525 family SAM-dependent methyltransferase n=1 Tax=Streptomyces sp. Li-HN-5-11 TaxID=3075432 RepID=UPI0028A842D4|nr:SCO2525 family SAM-dependent methyltransferase [Streptomyces sp. Li-HN-5-11]WNM31205.1 SCO2525 family SAM-dependent methyltransferase [Streptomyces sp. Li-HN-5-11]